MTSLSAGSEVDSDSFTLFVVNMELTENGLQNIPDIVQSVFQFIRYCVCACVRVYVCVRVCLCVCVCV